MRRASRMIAVVVAAGLCTSGCYGPFALTKQLHSWNGRVGDRYENEAVFVLFVLLPVYMATVAVDAVIFNSVTFWTGKKAFSDSSSN